MKVKIVERQAITVVGMQTRTRPMSPEIPALWPKFMARVAEIPDPSEPRVTYGVMQHEPPDTLLYMPAVAVKSAGGVPQGMTHVVIPAGTYAAFRYPLSALGAGYDEIFNRTLPASGFSQAPGRPLFERYDENFDPANSGSSVEICIPVSPKA